MPLEITVLSNPELMKVLGYKAGDDVVNIINDMLRLSGMDSRLSMFDPEQRADIAVDANMLAIQIMSSRAEEL